MRLATFALTVLLAATAGADEVAVAVQGGKSGAGQDEIRIFSDGRVRLSKTPMMGQRAQIKEGRIPVASAQRLFELIEASHVFDLDDYYENDRKMSHWNAWIVEVKLGDKSKRVVVDQGPRPAGAEPLAQFHELIGAVKLAAALALPEAAKQRFLRWL